MHPLLLRSTLCWFLCLLPSGLVAHPHVWIDLRVTLLTNEQGQLTGLRQSWRFDPFYSLLVQEELQAGGSEWAMQQREQELASQIIGNLQPHQYFTRLRNAQGQRLAWQPVRDYTLIQTRRRVELSFELLLETPLSLEDSAFTYQVYDPSYYIEILHVVEEGIQAGRLPSTCRVSVEDPQPSAELIMKALALDEQDVPEDPELGRHFAETIRVVCP